MEGETADHRHARRAEAAHASEAELRAWCDANGWTFNKHNYGTHWAFRHGDIQADWWPNTAKLVIDKRWDRGIHCHDYQQVITFLKRETGDR